MCETLEEYNERVRALGKRYDLLGVHIQSLKARWLVCTLKMAQEDILREIDLCLYQVNALLREGE